MTQAFDIQGLDDVLSRLQALPKEVVQKRGGPVRKVLRNAAHIIRDEAKRNAQRIVSKPNIGGDDNTTGRLVKSIRTVKGRQHKTLNGERYFVLIPKRARYPINTRSPTGMPVAMVGRLLEYGFSTPMGEDGRPHHREPMPWMRPAFHSKKGESVRYVQRELPREIDKVVKKLARMKR